MKKENLMGCGHTSLQGFYKLQTETKETPWFSNLITDTGLDLLGTTSIRNATSYCLVGTGSTTPLETDTTMTSQTAISNSNGGGSGNSNGSSPYYWEFTKSYVFTKGSFSDSTNLAEVGVCKNSNSTGLFSHALILDGGGSPTTFTVNAIDQLTVSYKVRVYAMVSDVPWGPIVVDSVSYSGLIRAAMVTQSIEAGVLYDPYTANHVWDPKPFSGVIGSVTEMPASPIGVSESNRPSRSLSAYISGNHYRDWTVTWPIGGANSAGIQAFTTSQSTPSSANGPVYQISISPPLPKDNTETLTIKYRYSWGRYVP